MTFAKFYGAALVSVCMCVPVSGNAADLPREQAEADCGGYVTVAMSVAIDPGQGALLHASGFYQPNKHRALLGPVHAVTFYDPDLGCKGDAGPPPPPGKR